MVSMTARTAASTEEMAETLTGRLRALARAHELIRSSLSSPSQQSRHTTLRILVESVLEAHAPSGDQLKIEGEEVPVGAGGATSLALVLHELATNAAKYGALSEPTGKVTISWHVADGKLFLTWIERGGPAVAGPPSRKGFGAELARMSARGQLGGDIAYAWTREGAEIMLRASLERLAA
jgi:two-component sensor histidine kinase